MSNPGAKSPVQVTVMMCVSEAFIFSKFLICRIAFMESAVACCLKMAILLLKLGEGSKVFVFGKKVKSFTEALKSLMTE